MSNKMILKKAEDFVTSKWSGGSTTELYIYPPQAVYREGNFKCRISSATVEVEKSDFTSSDLFLSDHGTYSGVARYCP